MTNVLKEGRLLENNPDTGASILYGLRYTKDELIAKQAQLIRILEEQTIITENGDGTADLYVVSNKIAQIYALIEELVCVKEGLNVHMYNSELAGKGLNTFLQQEIPITEILKNISDDTDGLGELGFHIQELSLGRPLHDLMIAHDQNGVMTKSQLKLFATFLKSREEALKFLQGRNVLIGF